RSAGTSAKPIAVATFEAKLPSPRNSSGFMVATTIASGTSMPAAESAACDASAIRDESDSLRRPMRVIAPPATKTSSMAATRVQAGAKSVNSRGLSAREARADSPGPRGPGERRLPQPGAPPGRRGRGHLELAHQAQQVRPLQAERAGGVGAVPAQLVERR